MSIRAHRAVAVLSAAALLGGAGFGVAQAQSSSSGGKASKAGRHGPGCAGPASTAQIEQIASKLGVTAAALKSALEASRPARPSGDGPKGGPQQLAADLASALGVETSAVQEILDANRPAQPTGRPPRGAKPPKPDQGALVSALASGLSLDEATVKAAFDKLDAARQADEAARRTAMYAGVAKTLGLDTSAVQAAFEAVLPAKPAR
jgi:hypothetical protein